MPNEASGRSLRRRRGEGGYIMIRNQNRAKTKRSMRSRHAHKFNEIGEVSRDGFECREAKILRRLGM